MNERLMVHAKLAANDIEKELVSIGGIRPAVVLYTPHRRATDSGRSMPLVEVQPRSAHDGRVTGGELAAMLVAYNEVALLGEMRKNSRGLECIAGLVERTGVSREELSDLVEGMSDFIYYLGFAAGVRERVVRQERRPDEAKDPIGARWWDYFCQAVSDDDFFLGCATCRAGVRAVGEISKNQNREAGAKLAAELYLAIMCEGPEAFAGQE